MTGSIGSTAHTGDSDLLVVSLVDLNLAGTIYRISNSWNPITYSSNVYQTLGSLLEIGPIQENYSTPTQEVTISVTGIPNDVNFKYIIDNENIEGGEVEVIRLFMDPETYATVDSRRSFTGIINSYVVEEEYSALGSENSLTLVFNTIPTNQFLLSQKRGQLTSPGDRKSRFGNTDTTFSRVPSAVGLNS